MLNKTITDFKQYLAATGLKQYEAAEQLGIEKGHLNRILTGKRNLTPQMAVDMRRLMGEKDILSLEECMEKYPIGSRTAEVDCCCPFNKNPEECGEVKSFWYKGLEVDGNNLYELYIKEDDYCYHFLLGSEKDNRYFIVTLYGETVLAHYTSDGLTFQAGFSSPDNYIQFKEDAWSEYSNTLIKPDFSNLSEVIYEVCDYINKKFNTSFTAYPTFEIFLEKAI